MERENITTEFRLIDEFGNDTKLIKETTVDSTENGTDIYFLYEEFVKFLKAAGFGDSTIDKIQYIDGDE